MDTASNTQCTAQIGDTAGQVWHALNERGPLTYAKLVKLMGVSRDTVMQAIGWLAREGKVDIDEASRGRIVSLR
jgi:DNA-binding GntR family transcriptional regulator